MHHRNFESEHKLLQKVSKLTYHVFTTFSFQTWPTSLQLYLKNKLVQLSYLRLILGKSVSSGYATRFCWAHVGKSARFLSVTKWKSGLMKSFIYLFSFSDLKPLNGNVNLELSCYLWTIRQPRRCTDWEKTKPKQPQSRKAERTCFIHHYSYPQSQIYCLLPPEFFLWRTTCDLFWLSHI